MTAPARASIALTAHQGGWDELLLVAGPIAVIIGLVLLARRRASQAQSAPTPAEPEHRPSRSDQ